MLFLALTLAAQRPDIRIADFEQATYENWSVSGKALGASPARGTLPNQMVVSGFRGKGLVNTFAGGDDSIGTLTSPTFKIERRYINFLLGGGYRPDEAYIELLIDGHRVERKTGRSRTPQDTEALTWATWNVERWQGKTARIRIVDNARGSWGHINVDEIGQSDTQKDKPEKLYHEAHRPQFHFSAKKNWLNDPNGLVYQDGEYHLFFQHNPTGIQWGNMHWGHAVSPDLVHWQELPIAIGPDQFGPVFSGSAVVDKDNTAGFGKNALVVLWTGAGNPAVQCLAYSLDKGRTFTKYKTNPILGNLAQENRDPKVFWHEPTRQWIMALYLIGDEFAIFGSSNLKEWKELSRLHLPGSSECPELFEMPVEGSADKKWIFYGGNFRYQIGSFDGKVFKPESGPFVGDHGHHFYASQTWNDVPDGRRIVIGWMNAPGPLPGMPFNQQMSIPNELRLVQTPEGLRLSRRPVRELEKLRGPRLAELSKLRSGVYDIHVAWNGTEPCGLKVRGVEITIDPKARTISMLGKTAPLPAHDGKWDLRVLVDRASLEVFAQDGLVAMTSGYQPAPEDTAVTIIGPNPASIEAYELKSAW